MKVLMQSRVSLFKVPGGDTIQILKTKEYLEKLGVKVDISLELEPKLDGYDLIHLFNLIRPQEVYLQAKNAKQRGKKVILSPIYVSYREYEKEGRGGILGCLATFVNASQIEYFKIFIRAMKNIEFHRGTRMVMLKGYAKLQNRILGMVDYLLPNSYSEMSRIIENFDIASLRYSIIPNSADENLFDLKVRIDKEMEKYRDCILCVARIEGRKNQLNLVRALNDAPYTLVLIGDPAPNHQKYFKQIKKEAKKNIHILGEINHNLLPQFYALAKVHVLASWMETTGLSSLEAGLMGCNLVITDRGDTKEYFKDYAYYCEPDSIVSIRNAVSQAYENPVNPQLRQYILDNFTWQKTAEKTLEVYKSVMQ